MKRNIILYLLAVAATMALLGCRANIRPVPLESRTDSIYIDKLIPIPTPPDSAAIRAQMECDERGQVVLRWLDMANSKNVDLQFKLDSLGLIIANMRVIHDTIYQPSREIIVYRDREVPVEVERKLSTWEQTKINYGGYAIMAVIVVILIIFGKFVYKLKK